MTVFEDSYNLGEYLFIAGSTQTFIFQVTENGAPVNLTGSTCSAKICPLGQNSVVVASLSGVITDAGNGIFSCILPGSTTSLWDGGKFLIQPKMLDASSVPHINGQALLTILDDIG